MLFRSVRARKEELTTRVQREGERIEFALSKFLDLSVDDQGSRAGLEALLGSLEGTRRVVEDAVKTRPLWKM